MRRGESTLHHGGGRERRGEARGVEGAFDRVTGCQSDDDEQGSSERATDLHRGPSETGGQARVRGGHGSCQGHRGGGEAQGDARGDEALVSDRLRLTAERWAGVEHADVEVEGVGALRSMMGL